MLRPRCERRATATINTIADDHTCMDTERSLSRYSSHSLRHLLTAALVLFIVCVFTVTPITAQQIAPAECIEDTVFAAQQYAVSSPPVIPGMIIIPYDDDRGMEYGVIDITCNVDGALVECLSDSAVVQSERVKYGMAYINLLGGHRIINVRISADGFQTVTKPVPNSPSSGKFTAHIDLVKKAYGTIDVKCTNLDNVTIQLCHEKFFKDKVRYSQRVTDGHAVFSVCTTDGWAIDLVKVIPTDEYSGYFKGTKHVKKPQTGETVYVEVTLVKNEYY